MSLRDDLVSWWELNEESGTRYDAHGDNDLTDNNTVTYDTGKVGNGAFFDQDNTEYLSIADGSQTGLDLSGDCTFAFWAKVQEDTDKYMAIVTKDGNGANITRSYLLYYDNRNFAGYPRFVVSLFGDSYSYPNNYWNGYYTYTLTAGTIYQVGITVDISEATDKVRLWINGSAVGYFTKDDGNGTTTIQNSTADFQMGYVSHLQPWDGLLDEFVIASRIWSADDFTEYYNSGDGMSYADTEEVSTGTNTQINIGDTFKTVEEYKLNVGDEWKTVTEMKLNVGDEWKTVF